MKIFIPFLLLILSFKTHAVGLGIGTYVPTIVRYQDTNDGSRDSFQFNPYFSVTTYWRIFGDHFLAPELGVAFHTGTEEEYSKRTTSAFWHLAWQFHSKFLFRYGLGTFWTRISGDGEEVELPNGNTTATFYAPTESSTSFNSTLDLGVEYIMTQNWGSRLDFFILQPFSSNRRGVSYLLSMVFVP
ncbi:MAG: hypothetical protein COW01_11590 [Bdellovibrionales bacterium CG12_big_fil_rev_8_21_14_0_65_38_15]|nr:MAG: hypothetical protein COW79_11620 [Bdellovibrionales bacterium CG22_combo_CG10-13_8_21_14_all_38_13]PIQ54254.1 MAG: hypothetical protein COW01_11590 [Bdellovibrionales bacterium CG12_big_fil_rev_8_21_14_0_65_38_15]PIR29310.1 MAG: hypothetical protein COV38_11235 [Bdellovibrionales bacterium CG11_big_fil_rev_8_21_14_0_20_38_13]